MYTPRAPGPARGLPRGPPRGPPSGHTPQGDRGSLGIPPVYSYPQSARRFPSLLPPRPKVMGRFRIRNRPLRRSLARSGITGTNDSRIGSIGTTHAVAQASLRITGQGLSRLSSNRLGNWQTCWELSPRGVLTFRIPPQWCPSSVYPPRVQKVHIFAPRRCKREREWGGSAHYPDPTAQAVCGGAPG